MLQLKREIVGYEERLGNVIGDILIKERTIINLNNSLDQVKNVNTELEITLADQIDNTRGSDNKGRKNKDEKSEDTTEKEKEKTGDGGDNDFDGRENQKDEKREDSSKKERRNEEGNAEEETCEYEQKGVCWFGGKCWNKHKNEKQM